MLHDNQLTGTIPAELGQLTQLGALVLKRQPIDGGNPGGAGPTDPTADVGPLRQPTDGRDPEGAGPTDPTADVGPLR